MRSPLGLAVLVASLAILASTPAAMGAVGHLPPPEAGAEVTEAPGCGAPNLDPMALSSGCHGHAVAHGHVPGVYADLGFDVAFLAADTVFRFDLTELGSPADFLPEL